MWFKLFNINRVQVNSNQGQCILNLKNSLIELEIKKIKINQ